MDPRQFELPPNCGCRTPRRIAHRESLPSNLIHTDGRGAPATALERRGPRGTRTHPTCASSCFMRWPAAGTAAPLAASRRLPPRPSFASRAMRQDPFEPLAKPAAGPVVRAPRFRPRTADQPDHGADSQPNLHVVGRSGRRRELILLVHRPESSLYMLLIAGRFQKCSKNCWRCPRTRGCTRRAPRRCASVERIHRHPAVPSTGDDPRWAVGAAVEHPMLSNQESPERFPAALSSG